MDHPEFKDVVINAWNVQQVDTISKLDSVGKALNKWSRKSFGNIFQEMENTKNDLLNVQMRRT